MPSSLKNMTCASWIVTANTSRKSVKWRLPGDMSLSNLLLCLAVRKHVKYDGVILNSWYNLDIHYCDDDKHYQQLSHKTWIPLIQEIQKIV